MDLDRGARHRRAPLRRVPNILFASIVFLGLSLRSLWLRDDTLAQDLPAPFPDLGRALGSFSLPILAVCLVCLFWLASRLLERPRRPWSWGDHNVFLPLLGLSLLMITGLDPARSERTSFEVAKLLAFTWFVYLYIVNERPDISLPLAAGVLIQGAVAVLQFLSQGDLGLRWLGELHLSTEVDGISILWVQDRAWIRGYGLTDHPNLLGTLLAVGLLALTPAFGKSRGWTRAALAAALVAGFLGLLTTFSRAAWIGFAAGVAVYLILGNARGTRPSVWALSGKPRVFGSALVLLAVLFLLPYRELVLSRVLTGDNPVEVRSISDRERDARLALDLIVAHPWTGVGAGGFEDAARALKPDAVTVHDVPLLVTAELGLPGAALWLWLVAGSILVARRRLMRWVGEGRAGALPAAALWLPPWVASLANGLFDPNPWPLLMLSSAILFGLMTGSLGSVDSTTEARGTRR